MGAEGLELINEAEAGLAYLQRARMDIVNNSLREAPRVLFIPNEDIGGDLADANDQEDEDANNEIDVENWMPSGIVQGDEEEEAEEKWK